MFCIYNPGKFVLEHRGHFSQDFSHYLRNFQRVIMQQGFLFISGVSRVPGSRVTLETFESQVLISPARFQENGPLPNCAPIKIGNYRKDNMIVPPIVQNYKKCDSTTNKYKAKSKTHTCFCHSRFKTPVRP